MNFHRFALRQVLNFIEIFIQEYERQFQQLRNILSPTTPYAPYAPYDPLRLGKITPNTPTSQMRVEKWAQVSENNCMRDAGKQLNKIVTTTRNVTKCSNGHWVN